VQVLFKLVLLRSFSSGCSTTIVRATKRANRNPIRSWWRGKTKLNVGSYPPVRTDPRARLSGKQLVEKKWRTKDEWLGYDFHTWRCNQQFEKPTRWWNFMMMKSQMQRLML
jgi:hypothetical protein